MDTKIAIEIELERLRLLELDASKGGPGSGNFGHRGRPGSRGGSMPGGGGGGSQLGAWGGNTGTRMADDIMKNRLSPPQYQEFSEAMQGGATPKARAYWSGAVQDLADIWLEDEMISESQYNEIVDAIADANA